MTLLKRPKPREIGRDKQKEARVPGFTSQL